MQTYFHISNNDGLIIKHQSRDHSDPIVDVFTLDTSVSR